MNLGKLRMWYNRARSYLSIAQFAMICYVFFDKIDFHWWYLLIVFLGCLFMIFDIIYIYPKEADYHLTRSKSFKGIIKKLDNIEKLIAGD